MGLLSCFQCWRGHADSEPDSHQQDGKCSTPTSATTSSSSHRGADNQGGQQAMPAPCRTAISKDAEFLPEVRHPSAKSDNGRHSAVPSQLYRTLRTINSGANGRVLLAEHKQTGERVAIKMVPRGWGSQAQLCSRELLNHQKLAGHPHIIEIQEVFLTRNHLALVMEFADGGDMSEAVDKHILKEGGPLPEARARALFQQLITAVDYSHRLGVSSRDVKLDNMLLCSAAMRQSGSSQLTNDSTASAADAAAVTAPADGSSTSAADDTARWHAQQQLKLADFGLSKAMELSSREAHGTVCGTPEYMAPEVLRGMKYNGRRADIWSCGVVLYTMVSGDYPFLARSEERLTRPERMAKMFPRILSGTIQPLPAHMSQVADLLRRMLEPNTARRIAISDIFAHPWYRVGLPAELASLNDRLLEDRARSPPKPVITSGVAAMLEAAWATKASPSKPSPATPSPAASSERTPGDPLQGPAPTPLGTPLPGAQPAGMHVRTAAAAEAAVAAAGAPDEPPQQQQQQQQQQAPPMSPASALAGRASAGQLLSDRRPSGGAGLQAAPPLLPSAARASAAAEAAMLSAMGMDDLVKS